MLKPKSILKAKYTITPVPDTDLYEIGITPRDLLKLTFKATAWSSLPYAVVVAGMLGYGSYLLRQDEKKAKRNAVPTNEN